MPGSPSNLKTDKAEMLLIQKATLCLKGDITIIAANMTFRADLAGPRHRRMTHGFTHSIKLAILAKGGSLQNPHVPFPQKKLGTIVRSNRILLLPSL